MSESRIAIIQGEYAVSKDPNAVITTMLGSCVAACIYDLEMQIGGMNHFLLPGSRDGTDQNMRYGVHLMELTINGLLKLGARKDRLVAKLFGGGNTVQGLQDIGSMNIKFAESYLDYEGIRLNGGSTGGNMGRRIQFWPGSGRAQQKFIRSVLDAPASPVQHSKLIREAGELELF